jgi:hypothetical protein
MKLNHRALGRGRDTRAGQSASAAKLLGRAAAGAIKASMPAALPESEHPYPAMLRRNERKVFKTPLAWCSGVLDGGTHDQQT